MLNENEKKLVEILKRVLDPETDLDVINSGYVYGLTVNDNVTEIWMDFNQRVPGCSFCKVVAWKIIETLSTKIYDELKKEGYKNIRIVEAANPAIVYKEG